MKFMLRRPEEAREKNRTTIGAGISEVFRQNVEQERRPAGQSSFIAPDIAYEYQADSFLYNRYFPTKSLK